MIAPTDWLIAIGVRGATALLVWSWQALALLAFVWLALKILRMKSPALRHQVWLFGLAAVATLPLQAMALRSLPSLRPARRVLDYAAEAPRMVIDFTPQPPARTPPEDAADLTVAAPPVKAAAKTTPVSHFLFAALFAAWMIGAVITLARLMKNHVGVRRALKRAQSVRPADLGCGEFAAFVTGKARLRLSPDVSSPLLCGVFRPTILLPADIADWATPAESAAMIRHELAHVERRDPLVNLFQTALSVIFFFHPLVRYACRQLTLEREMACDDHVVDSGAEAEVYAESIIKAAERGIGSLGGARQLALFSTRQILERRIEMILDKDRTRVPAHHWRYLVLSAALIAAVSLLLLSSHAGKITAQPAVVSDDERLLIAMVRQVAEGIPRQINFGGPSPNPYLRFKDFAGDPGEDMWRKFDGFARRNLTVTRVDADDFHVKINGAEATVGFLGTIYFKDPVRGEENSVADRYTVEVVKANGRWQAVPPPPPPPPPRPVNAARNDAAPPPREQADEQTLLALIQEAAIANINRDTSVFERLLTDDYIGTGPNGEVTNKAQEIADVKRQDITITKFEIDDFRVRVNGDSAVTNFLGTVFYKTGLADSSLSVQYRYTCSFVKRNDRWLMLAIHMSGKR